MRLLHTDAVNVPCSCDARLPDAVPGATAAPAASDAVQGQDGPVTAHACVAAADALAPAADGGLAAAPWGVAAGRHAPQSALAYSTYGKH